MSLTEKFLSTSGNPIRYVEWVVALMAVVGGLFILTPLYDVQVARVGLSPFASALSSQYGILLWAFMLLIGAGLVIAGLVLRKPHLKYIGWYGVILARFFQLLTTWFVTGFFPISWIYPFTLLCVMVILWAVAKSEVDRYGSN